MWAEISQVIQESHVDFHGRGIKTYWKNFIPVGSGESALGQIGSNTQAYFFFHKS